MLPKGLLITAPSSGAGKTTLTLGLLRALRNKGKNIQPYKNGPDYIDPAFHRAASGNASVNIDTWAMDENRIAGLLSMATSADFAIAEGSMGMFDGVATNGAMGNGASADVAAITGWPVILVLDVSGQAQSAAAVAMGFKSMRPELNFAGVVLSRVASPRHERLIRDGMDNAGITVLGSLPRQKSIEMPERHLGLVQAEEQPELERILDELARFVEENVDLDTVIKAAQSNGRKGVNSIFSPPPGQRIALAKDQAFSFVYPHLMEGWRAAGAEIMPFSPLANEAPDQNADVCWLPGGYPELHAGRLSAADHFRSSLQLFGQSRPVHGECGGYMAMGLGLVDKDGVRHQMAGLLGLVTSYEKRKMHLGYRVADLLAPLPGYNAGSKLRGHEFHYSTILDQPDKPLANVTDATGSSVIETGSCRVWRLVAFSI